MANVFGILTAIVLALAGFVAYKNKAAYENEISETATQHSNLATSQKRLKTAQDNLAATIDQRTEVDTEVVKLTEEEIAQKKINEDLQSQIDEKTQKTASNKEKLDEIREKTAAIGDLNELAGKMKAAKAELEELSQTITAAEANLANLTAQDETTKTEAAGMQSKFDTISQGRSLPTLNTRIRSIYPAWGFVTLAAGNNGGVVANSNLAVVRDGEPIAQLLVTSVESNSASASIVPDSVKEDVTLMVGDRVVPATPAAKGARN